MGSRQNIDGKEWAAGGTSTNPGAVKVALGFIKEKPPYQTQNWLSNRADEMLGHIEVYGIPVWDVATIYVLNSYVAGSNGLIYQSIAGAFIGQDPVSSPTQWIKVFVDVNSVETITGTKTFDALKLGSDQDANNKKITNLAPPLSNQDATSKTYVDALDTANSVTDQGYTDTEVAAQSVIDQAYTDTEVANKIDKDGTTAYTGTGAGFKNQGDMADDDPLATSSQQAIKAFVEGQFPAGLSGGNDSNIEFSFGELEIKVFKASISTVLNVDTITFSAYSGITAFSNACFAVFMTDAVDFGDEGRVWIDNLSDTSFDYNFKLANPVAKDVRFIAIGR